LAVEASESSMSKSDNVRVFWKVGEAVPEELSAMQSPFLSSFFPRKLLVYADICDYLYI
jgi:hypothetical protein